MNLKTLKILTCLTFTPLTLFGMDEIKPDSEIKSVSLFKDGALITRVAEIDFPAGKSTVSFHSLPHVAASDSLQASIAASHMGVVRNATLSIPDEDAESATLLELEDKIQLLEESIKDHENEKTTANLERNFSRKLSQSFSEKYGEIGEGESLNIEQAKETWSYTQAILAKSTTTIKQADKAIQDLKDQIADLEEELEDEEDRLWQLSAIAEFEVEFSQATSTQMEISYIVAGASWTPRYELRATPSKKSLDFGYFASITQETGEDWNDVELSLHTNQVNRRGNVPELYPLVVNKEEPRVHNYRTRGSTDEEQFVLSPFEVNTSENSGWRSTNSTSGTSLNTNVREIPKSIKVINSDFIDGVETKINVSSSTVSFQLKLQGKPTIPSTPETITLPVLNKSFAAKYWSEVVPRAQLDAYLVGQVVNELEMPILPGQALAFVDGKLSSKVFLKKTLPQEELKLSLGTDGNIIVKRREGASKDSSRGFIDKSTNLKREFFNTVSNFHKIAHDVVVIDQFPLSRNSKIQIKRIAPLEDSVEFDEEQEGVFQWSASIPAGEEKSFTTSYEITHPKDWEVTPKL